MIEETTQPQDKPTSGTVMDVQPPASPSGATTLTAIPDVIEEHETTEMPESEDTVVQAPEDSAAADTGQATNPVTAQETTLDTPQSAQEETAGVPPEPVAQPASQESEREQTSPLLVARPKTPQKHGVRWVLVFAVLILLGLAGAAVAAYRATNTSHTDSTHMTQSHADANMPQQEDAQSAISEASDTIDEALKEQDETDLPENELSDDQLGL